VFYLFRPRGCLTVVLIVGVLAGIGAIASACSTSGGKPAGAASRALGAVTQPATSAAPTPATSPKAAAPPPATSAPAPPPATSPAAAAPPPPASSDAWCTASASVYDAYYDENNVYVNSNQPYTDATAGRGQECPDAVHESGWHDSGRGRSAVLHRQGPRR
jgi:hypothetical protein